MDSILAEYIPLAMFLSLLFGLSQLFVRGIRGRNILLFLLFFCFTLTFWGGWRVFRQEWSPFFWLYVPSLFLMGPLLYRLVLDFSPDFQLKPPGSPRNLLLILVWPLLGIGSLLVLSLLASRQFVTLAAVRYVIFSGHLFIIGWFVAGLQKGFYVLSLTNLRERAESRLALILSLDFFLYLGLFSCGLLFRIKAVAMSGFLFLFIVVLLSFFVMVRYPGFFFELREIGIKTRYKKSTLAGVDQNEIESGIDRLMEEERIYQDEELTLARLAERLNLSTHQLSEYLNAQKQISFNDFVNRFRVKEAITLIQEKSDWPVLRIGYEVGFNSKSAFYNAFKKETGKRPTAYRANSVPA